MEGKGVWGGKKGTGDGPVDASRDYPLALASDCFLKTAASHFDSAVTAIAKIFASLCNSMPSFVVR